MQKNEGEEGDKKVPKGFEKFFKKKGEENKEAQKVGDEKLKDDK